MKKIAHEIIDSEVKKYNMKMEVFPVTFVEYCKDEIFNKKYSLQRKVNLVKESSYENLNKEIKNKFISIFPE